MQTETIEYSQNIESTGSNQKLKFKEKFSYGLGNLSANLLITTANTFITFYYTEVAGIAIAIVGTLLLFARIFDGASDLVMGVVVDKTRTKHGKGRPWLLWLAIPYGLAIILLFSSPDFSMTGKIIYAFVTYVLAVGVIYTAISVPYNSMTALITQNQSDRAQLSGFRTMLGFTGAMALTMGTMPIVNFFGGGQKGWTMTSIIFAVVGIALYLICFKNTTERVVATVESKTAKGNVKTSIVSLLKNKYWIMVMSVMFIGFINSGLGGINVYYAQYILGNPTYVGIIGLASFLPIILGTFIVSPIIGKFGKRNMTIYGTILSIIGSLIIAINPSSFLFVVTGLVVRGLGLAPLLVASFAMLGDTIEYGEWKTGIRSEGLAFSAGTFGEKVGTGVGGALIGVILGAAGYIGGQAEQGAGVLNSIQFVFTYLPILFSIITLIILYFYKLDKEYPFILKELNERKRTI